jgi:hypothetical protein
MTMPAPNFPYLVLPGLFTCPRCGPSAVVPPTGLLDTGALLTQLAGRCSRCEHPYQFTTGAPSTTTTGAANVQGATALTVASGSSFTSGSWVVVDATSVDGGAEILIASGAGTSTTIPVASTPLRLTHAAGAAVATGTLAALGPLT